MTEILYHLVQQSIWDGCRTDCKDYFPPTYTQDGFIHLTKDPKFLLEIGNLFYKDVPGNFLLLVLEAERLAAKVIFEPAAPVGSTSSSGLGVEEELPLFPHLYGTINRTAVVKELIVQRDHSGSFLSIEGLHT